MGDETSALIQLGVVGAPFGVRGWVKLRSHMDPPEGLLKHRRLHLSRSAGAFTVYRIEASGRSGGALTAKFIGIEDRDQAAALTGAGVFVARADLPKGNDKDYYRADLIGCEVENLQGLAMGTVQHFIETPAQTLMVVRGEREYWVPAAPKHLRRVDLQARRVVVDWDAEAG
jgi:16S rRNA processing protein RimM